MYHSLIAKVMKKVSIIVYPTSINVKGAMLIKTNHQIMIKNQSWLRNCNQLYWYNSRTMQHYYWSFRVDKATKKHKLCSLPSTVSQNYEMKHLGPVNEKLHGGDWKKMQGTSNKMTKKCHETNTEVWGKTISLQSSSIIIWSTSPQSGCQLLWTAP